MEPVKPAKPVKLAKPVRRNTLAEILADPTKSFLAYFVVGTLIFTLVSDGVSGLFWEVVEGWAKTQLWMSEFAFQVGVRSLLVLLVLAMIYFTRFTDWLTDLARSRLVAFGFLPEARISDVMPLEQTYPGLIVIMSAKAEESPAEAAIRYHLQNDTLKYCWIICTRLTWEPARQMVDRLKQSGAQTVRFYYGSDPIENVELRDQSLTLLISDGEVDNPNHSRKLVEGIYANARNCGLDEAEIIADYTGGTKGMTAGLILACTKPERSLQYISQLHYPQIMSVQISYRLKQE